MSADSPAISPRTKMKAACASLRKKGYGEAHPWDEQDAYKLDNGVVCWNDIVIALLIHAGPEAMAYDDILCKETATSKYCYANKANVINGKEYTFAMQKKMFENTMKKGLKVVLEVRLYDRPKSSGKTGAKKVYTFSAKIVECHETAALMKLHKLNVSSLASFVTNR